HREMSLGFQKHLHTVETPRVVGHTTAVLEFDRQQIPFGIDLLRSRVLAFSDTVYRAAFAVAYDVLTSAIAGGPLPVGRRHVSTCQDHGRTILLLHQAFRLQHSVNDRVGHYPLTVSRDHGQVPFRLRDIPLSQRKYPIAFVDDLDDSALLAQR